MIDPRVQEAMDLLQEECSEIIQIISKIRRFGFDSYSPYDPERRTNRRLFNDEVGDFEVLKKFLMDRDILDEVSIEDRVNWKTGKLKSTSTIFDD